MNNPTTNLTEFNFKGQAVRTVTKGGEPWWVLKDVCDVLGLTTPARVAERLDGDEVSLAHVTDSIGRKQETTIVNESGLYNVIIRSDKPEAKHFKRWVTHEVLPTIRKTGGYVANENTFIETYLPYADEQTRNLFKATLATVRSLNTKIEADRPKVLFAQAVEASKTSILVGELAKLLKQNGYPTGQNRLFQWLRDNGFLIKNGSDRNMPTQRAMELGLFEIKESTVVNADGSIRITKTTKVTGKGQTYFINKLLPREGAILTVSTVRA